MKTAFFFLSLLFGLGLALAATGSGPGHLLIALILALALSGLVLGALWRRLSALPLRVLRPLASGPAVRLAAILATDLAAGLATGLASCPRAGRPALATDLQHVTALLALMGLMLAANTGIQP